MSSGVAPAVDKALCVYLGEDRDVITCVSDDRGFPRRSRGCVDPDNIAHRNSQHPVRVGVPKLLLVRKWQVLQILDRADIGAVQLPGPVRRVD